MRRQIAMTLCWAALGVMTSSSLTTAQQKSAKACLDEWQANRSASQTNGVTRKAYLAKCRAGGASAAGGDRQLYASVKDLMESIVDPSADALWNAVGTIADQDGIHELLPKTDEEWRDVRHAAVRIIEGGNLLMMPGRDAAPAGTKSETPGVELEPDQIAALINKKRKEFNAFAKDLQLLGAEALRASENKNTDMLIEIGGRMENVCEGCHQTFWYPPDHAAAARK